MGEPALDPLEIARRTRAAALQAASVTAGADNPPRRSSNGKTPEQELAQVQATSEGVVHGDQLFFMGEYFRVCDKVGLMPLMKFAAAADSDLDTSDMAALAAIYSMLQDCIYPGQGKPGDGDYDAGDWKRFERHATVMKASAEDLLPVVKQAVEILTARPM